MAGTMRTFLSIRPPHWFSPIFDGFQESENIYIAGFNKNDIYANLRRAFHGLQERDEERELEETEILG